MTDPMPGVDPLVSSSLSTWFSRSSAVVRHSFGPLLVIQLAVFVPVAVIVGVAGGLGYFPDEGVATSFGFPYRLQTGSTAVQILSGVLGVLGLGASVFVIVRTAAGRAWRVGEAFGFAGSRFVPLLLWIVLASILTVIGVVLLVIPGIYLTVVFTGALLGVVVIERRGLGRTFTLVNQKFFGVLGRLLLLTVLSFVYQVVVTLLAGLPSLGAFPGDPIMIVSLLLANLLSIPLTIYWIAALVVLYAELRALETPGVGPLVL